MAACFRPLLLLPLLLWLAACAEPRPELPINTRLGGEFVLTDQHGKEFHSSALDGRLVLIFFGFTQCPDICPATLARTVSAWKALDGSEQDQVQIVFVSFDPERDTPAHLLTYLAFFDPSVIGLTGSKEQIATVASQYGVVYLQEEPASTDADYLFSHSDFVYLLDRQGRVRKLFRSDFDQQELLADVRSLL